MLDTNICIYLIKRRPEIVLTRLQEHSPSEVCISSITLAELEYGVSKSSHPEKNRAALALFVVPLQVSLFDASASEHYGLVRSELERAGTPIGPLDTLIAGHARSLGATLVTNNVREFRRVPDLAVENWLG